MPSRIPLSYIAAASVAALCWGQIRPAVDDCIWIWQLEISHWYIYTTEIGKYNEPSALRTTGNHILNIY